MPVAAWEGEVVVVGAVVVLAALPVVVVAPGPPPFGPVRAAAGPAEDPLDVLLEVPPLAGLVVDVTGKPPAVAVPEVLLVEVAAVPDAGVAEVTKGVAGVLEELAVEPATVLVVVPGTLATETLVEVAVVPCADVGEVVPGGTPGTLVEVEPMEVTLVVLGTVLLPEVVVTTGTVVELEAVVVVFEVGSLVRVESAQGALAERDWAVGGRSPRTVVLVPVGARSTVVDVAALVVVVDGAAGPSVVGVHEVVVVEDVARLGVATVVVVVGLVAAVAAVAVSDTVA